MSFVEGPTVHVNCGRTTTYSYVTNEIELATSRTASPVFVSNQNLCRCGPVKLGTEQVLLGDSASDCNVDVTGDVTVKCHDTAFR